MFDTAAGQLRTSLKDYPWASELAGILPLSALVDFIEVPPKLHILQLRGFTPLWSWPVTPAGSRLLLSHDQPVGDICLLDRFGNSIGLVGLDGFYGDKYFVSNPETVRLSISTIQPRVIDNIHPNMSDKDARLQDLEVIHVSRSPVSNRLMPPISEQYHHVPQFPWMYLARYVGVSTFGWVLLLAIVLISIILQAWVSLAFLVLMPITGSVVTMIYGNNPRRLLVNECSSFNRLILVAEHANTTRWIVFYGESTILSSLLNRPLKPTGSRNQLNHLSLLRMTLRVLILGQWGLVLGAASLKDWNAYLLCFWIFFCIFVHAYILPASREASEWCKFTAGIQLERYQTKLSSRRALINTVVALNPDTFTCSPETEQEDRTRFHHGAMKWVDYILESGPSRAKWEQATLEAMNETVREFPMGSPDDNVKHEKDLSAEWNTAYEKDYWKPFVPEGIYMAHLIRKIAELPGRKVRVQN